MKKILLINVFFLSLFMAYGQVSKTNTISGTVTNVPASGAHIDRTFDFLASDFSGCTGLTEVEISIQLILGNGIPPTLGAYGVHEDLNVRLVSPTGTTVDLIQDRWGYWIGMVQTNTYSGFTALDGTMHFDDDHPTSVIPVGVNEWTTGNFSPHNPLSTFDGESPVGTWTLRISDGNNQFGVADYFHFVESTLTITCGVSCTEPTIPTLTASPSTTCTGGTASLNISGTLNDATAWQVYTGSCGGTDIGTTTTGTFAIPGTITAPTTYFVRGEGGCTTPGTCGSITITPQALDDASFTYSAASFCVDDTDPTPTITGLGGGSFSAGAGLSINSTTGQIDVSVSTPGTYTVTYSTTGACPNSSNVSVTINALDDPSFTYGAASYCVNDTDPTPTITGLGGGSFSAGAGLSINSTTGQIDVSVSTPGTYTVTYSTTGACPNSSNVSVTINALDDPSFTYGAASYCVNDTDPTPTITGLGGGSFSAGAGLSINSTTGQIDVSVSTPGTYTVTYSTTGACPNSSSVSVTINALDDPSFNYSAASYCVNDTDPTPTITGLLGGSFSAGAGLSINSTTGQIDVSASTPGTYIVTYSTTGACPNSSNVSVTINALNDPSFNYSAASYCVNDTDPTPTITGLGGGSFSAGAGLSINSTTGQIDVSVSTPGSYTVTYSTTGACPNSSNVSVTINALDDPSFTYGAASYCVNDTDPTPTITGLGGGSFSAGAGLSINSTTGQIDVSVSTPGSYTVTYSTTGACPNSSSVSVTVQSTVSATFTALSDLCIDSGIQAGLGGGAPTGGVYSGPGVTDDGNGMTYSFDPVAAGAGVHTITYTPAGVCSASVNDQIEVFALPSVTFTPLADLCIDAGLQVGLGGGSPLGGVYSGAGVTDDGNGSTYSFDPAVAGVGTHTITYTFTNANGCTGSASNQVEIFGLPTVIFTALADLCVNDGVQAGLGGGNPMSGVYSGSGVTDDGNGMTYSFDPAVAGVGTHILSYTFTNANGCTNSTSDDIEVFALPTITFTAPGSFCLTQGIQTSLGGGTPMGGVYSGSGVTDDGNGMTYSFDPAAAGVGSHTVTYTVGVSGCTSSANGDIVVTAGGAVTALCQDATIYLDAFGNASITAADIDGGSSVGCGTLNLAASQTAFTCADLSIGVPAPSNDLIITGVYDGPLSGGTPKGVEIYVVNDIADLSQYGIGSANNGGGSDGEEFTFPAVAATAGQFIYVSSQSSQFTNFVGFAPDYTTSAMAINGDDALELFYQGTVIDVFGDINTDGSGEPWDYLDGWAYRNNNTGNDGSTWTLSNWSFSGIDALDNETTNATAATPIPLGTYSIQIAAPTAVTLTVTDGLGGSATCTANVTVADTISPTINCPADITQDQGAGICSADITIPNIVAADNCSGEAIAWTVSGATTGTGTGQPGVQTFAVGLSTVNVVATDASGNTANCSFTITVNDTTAPVMPTLSDLTDECSVTAVAPTATDACAGTITGTTMDPLTYNTQGTFVINWMFDDGSGNVTTASQNVIISDVTAPTASDLDTVFAECIGDVAIDETLVDDEADNCSANPIVTYVGDTASNGTGCNDTIIRTYNVADDAGNSIDVIQMIILNDTTAPTASNPSTLSVACLADVPAASPSWVIDEVDNCGAPIVTWLNDVSTNGTGCADTITRTFEVADACGNAIQVEQLIIVNDDVAPLVDNAVLADVVGFCDLTPVAPTATDNCSGSIDGVADVTFPIDAIGTTVVTWTFTDVCGNETTQTQNVIVEQINVNTFLASDGITIVSSNNDAGVTFQWYNCAEDTVLTGETNQNFTPTFSADFAVIVTQDGCVDTSACVTITEVGLDQLMVDSFAMYPNPTETGSFAIQVDDQIKSVSVLDMTGRLVEVDVNVNEKTVNVSNLVNGAYIVRVVTETEQQLVGTIRVQ